MNKIARDYNEYQQRLFTNLVSQTPIRSAKHSVVGKKTAKMGDVIKQGGKKVVIRNDVPYIERLDKGWSLKQEPLSNQ